MTKFIKISRPLFLRPNNSLSLSIIPFDININTKIRDEYWRECYNFVQLIDPRDNKGRKSGTKTIYRRANDKDEIIQLAGDAKFSSGLYSPYKSDDR